MTLKGMFSDILTDVERIVAPAIRTATRRSRRVAVVNGDAIDIYEIAGERVSRVGSKGSAKSCGELRIPASSVQARTIVLPAATRGYVEPVLDNRLDQLTPWAPDRVLYGYKIAGETEDGSIIVEFAATAHEIADKWLAKAEAAGFKADAIGAGDGPLDQPVQVDFWRGARDVRRARLRRALVVITIVALLVPLPILAASIWMLNVAEERATAIESRAAAARSSLANSTGGDRRDAALIATKTSEAALLTMIDRIAATLPDGTVLRELEIDSEKIQLAGSSDAAPALLSLLSRIGTLGEARFSAPVTRDAGGRDSFEIVANRVSPTAAGSAAQ